ncbi:MAG: hypothetical protein M3R07_10275 [Gemmatimonadota bacterium]|nr:hypothetical protein [Gemmatimonadota bacterium]
MLAHVVRTYFADSPEQAALHCSECSGVDIGDADVQRMRNTIRRARQNGR